MLIGIVNLSKSVQYADGCGYQTVKYQTTKWKDCLGRGFQVCNESKVYINLWLKFK